MTFGRSSIFDGLPRFERLSLALSAAFGTSKFHSAEQQDKWIAHVVWRDIENGFYVDVGAGDGVLDSNTKALDDLGWEGICIDPFPANMDTRTAKVFKDVVYSEKGHKVKFSCAGFVGGIVDQLGYTRDWKANKNAKLVEFTTTTIDDILHKADAPQYIHYMSVDIEGAELEALKGIDFLQYKIGALTIEHNYEEPKRSEIRSLLESKGYRHVFGLYRDDYYVLGEVRRDVK